MGFRGRGQFSATLGGMSQRDYEDGMADGLADRDPDGDRLAYGANRLNDYERGYVDSGNAAGPPPAMDSGPVRSLG